MKLTGKMYESEVGSRLRGCFAEYSLLSVICRKGRGMVRSKNALQVRGQRIRDTNKYQKLCWCVEEVIKSNGESNLVPNRRKAYSLRMLKEESIVILQYLQVTAAADLYDCQLRVQTVTSRSRTTPHYAATPTVPRPTLALGHHSGLVSRGLD